MSSPSSAVVAAPLSARSSRGLSPRTKPRVRNGLQASAGATLKPQVDTAGIVSDVHQTLSETRKHYDDLRVWRSKREEDVLALKESIRIAESANAAKSDSLRRTCEHHERLQQKYKDSLEKIAQADMSKKVYGHILDRTKKEQDLLRQRILKMEVYLTRKNQEVRDYVRSLQKTRQLKVQELNNLDGLQREVLTERSDRVVALHDMKGTLEVKKDTIKRRADFESWRQEVAMEAATEAFNASAGRMRKMYAMEKIVSHALQKMIYDQVKSSQATEDGFQRIREVAGMNEVVDIVDKFLCRDQEEENLKQTAKEAEATLEALRKEFQAVKDKTDCAEFDTEAITSRDLYLAVEGCDSVLKEALKEHSLSREKAQRTTLQLDQVTRLLQRICRLLSAEGVQVPGKPLPTPAFLQELDAALAKLEL